jgi:hypothetical protein
MDAAKPIRLIKNVQGEKVENKTTSINLELKQWKYVKLRNVNLSATVREQIDRAMAEDTDPNLEALLASIEE